MAANGPGPMPASSTTRTPTNGPWPAVAVIRYPRERFDSRAVTLAMIEKRPAGNKSGASRERTGGPGVSIRIHPVRSAFPGRLPVGRVRQPIRTKKLVPA
ncbi:hypothetical protein GCM10009760_33990 [Kitasatospora kazusensis]|uniref:Uncharacterized protein n=1 Tax=Kitasatospora kazusensis TaxID=407974 RepID=A0ABP5LDB9_9ACTN